MRVTIKKIGNSAYPTLPEAALAQFRLAVGDLIDIGFEQGRLLISPAQTHPRAGWEEAARELATKGDDGDDWLFFSNKGDEAV